MTRNNQINYTISRQNSFEIIFSFYIIVSILSNSFFALYLPNYSALVLISFCFLFVREIVINKFRIKTLFQTGLVLCFIALIWTSNNLQLTNPLISLIIFSLCARDLDYGKILEISFKLILTMLLIIIISSQLGIITDYVSNQAGRVRHFLGFLYALYPGTLIFELMLIAIYLNKSFKIKLFLVLLDFVVFIFTDSRLSFGLTLISLLMCSESMVKIVKKVTENNIIRILFSSVYMWFALLSIYISLIYTESVKWLYELNRLLSFRLRLCQQAIATYGITLTGKRVSFTGAAVNAYGINVNAGTEYFTVDNGYLDILIKYGVIAEVIYIILVSYLLYKLLKTGNYRLYLIICIIGIHLLIDFSMLNLIYNVFILVLFYRSDSLIKTKGNLSEKVRHKFRIVLSK